MSLPRDRTEYSTAFSGIITAVAAWTILKSDPIFPQPDDPHGGEKNPLMSLFCIGYHMQNLLQLLFDQINELMHNV